MIYLIWYLVVGVVVLSVMYISHQLSTHPESNPALELTKIARELTNSLDHARKFWRDNPLDNVVVPLLGMILILASWPVFLLMLAKDKLFPYKPIPERIFSVTEADLIRQMTVEEIEQQEHVTDPMGAVPDIPFGYLNAAWSRFKANLAPQDLIWSFTAQWTTNGGGREIREGYVIVRGVNIGPHFLNSLRKLEDVEPPGAPVLDIPTFLTKRP